MSSFFGHLMAAKAKSKQMGSVPIDLLVLSRNRESCRVHTHTQQIEIAHQEYISVRQSVEIAKGKSIVQITLTAYSSRQ
jgi:hypothetical protein